MTKVYTHGFEEIYALEKVDVRSIRPMVQEEIKKPQPKVPKFNRDKQLQMQLPLGDAFSETLPSFVLTEPIQQLNLARHLEAWLVSRSILSIEQLLKTEFEDLPPANLHEIREKMDAYVAGRSLHDTNQVDYVAWLRGLMGATQPLARYVFLEHWGLQELVDLQPQERLELRRLTDEKKQSIRDEQWQLFQSHKDVFSGGMRRVADALVRPWIRQRGGLATWLELDERLLAISEDVDMVKKVISFFSDVYSGGSFVLDRFLYHADLKLFCYDAAVADAYDAIIEKAQTYFYNDIIYYKLEHLEQLISRELAHQWNGFPDGFLNKALRLAPTFVVRKGDDHQLQIRIR